MKLSRNVIFLVVAMLLCFTLASAGCSTTSTSAAKHLSIGAIEPLTGFPVGVPWGRGYELYFEKVNEQGGIEVNGEKYLVDYFLEDDQLNPEISGTMAKKLVYENKVSYLFGSILDSCGEAIYTVTAPNKVLQLVFVNIPKHPADVSPTKPLCVRPNISVDAPQDADYKFLIKKYPNVKTVVISGPDLYPTSMFDTAKSVANANGVNVLDVQVWPMTTTDFVPIYTKILAQKPDAIHVFESGLAALQIRAVRQLGFTGPIISDAPLGADVVIAGAGPEASTNIICNGVDPSHPTDAMKEVMQRWNVKYGEPFVSDALMAWDGVQILVQAIEKAKSIDPEKVAATFETMNQPGSLETVFGKGYMGGMTRFGCNRVLVRPVPIIHIMGGEPKVVEYVTVKE